MDSIKEQYSRGNKYKVARLGKSVDINNSIRRSNLIVCINLIYSRNGYKIPEMLNLVQYNKDTIIEALNFLMSTPEISVKENLSESTNRCLVLNSKSIKRKAHTPKFNSETLTEIDYFKSERHIIGVKKIRRNYLKNVQDPTLYKFNHSISGIEQAEDGMATSSHLQDERDSLCIQKTSSTSSNTQPHNCSIASTNSSTITVDGDSLLQDIMSTGYASDNSVSMYELNHNNTENNEGEQMEAESYSYNSVSDEEMETEFYFHNDIGDQNELLEALSNPNNNGSNDNYELMEFSTLNNISNEANEEMEDSNMSNSEEDQLQQEYFHQVGTNEHIVESLARLMLYTNALMGIISNRQEGSFSI